MDNGFKSVLTDVFLTKTAGIQLAQYFDMNIVGSIPQCGFVKDHGYVDRLLLYKAINHLKVSVQSSKL